MTTYLTNLEQNGLIDLQLGNLLTACLVVHVVAHSGHYKPPITAKNDHGKPLLTDTPNRTQKDRLSGMHQNQPSNGQNH